VLSFAHARVAHSDAARHGAALYALKRRSRVRRGTNWRSKTPYLGRDLGDGKRGDPEGGR
jgi:hypothetical protein